MTAVIIISIVIGIAFIYFIIALKHGSDHTLGYLFGIAVCIMWFGALGNVLLDEKLAEFSNKDESPCKCECSICAECLNKD